MASREPPKKEENGKSVPMKEALDARVTELSTSLQEMMADGETLGQESSANETLLTTCRTDPSWSAPTNGLRHRESYCLLVQVVKDAIRCRDVRLPAHAWNEDIAVDICESRIGCLVGTYKVQLLSDTEFLLRKRPTSGPKKKLAGRQCDNQTYQWTFPLVWSSGFLSGWTLLQERSKI